LVIVKTVEAYTIHSARLLVTISTTNASSLTQIVSTAVSVGYWTLFRLKKQLISVIFVNKNENGEKTKK